MIAYFGKKLGESGHRISPDQICMMTEAWVADSGAKAVDEYGPYFLYFNNVLWHHGGNPPGQKANPMASGLCDVVVLRLRAAGESRAKR